MLCVGLHNHKHKHIGLNMPLILKTPQRWSICEIYIISSLKFNVPGDLGDPGGMFLVPRSQNAVFLYPPSHTNGYNYIYQQ